MSFRWPNLVSLNGVELSDESRGPVTETRDERSNVVELASGTKRKFIKAIKRQWEMEWDYLPRTASDTVDGKAGRDELRAAALLGTPLTFVMHDGIHSSETYTVFVTGYNDSLSLRREVLRYKVSLSLEEQ